MIKRTTYIILCLIAVTLSFSVAASSAIVPSVARTFGKGQFSAGAIVWIYMLPYGLAALIYGPLTRLLDSRKILLFSLSLFSFFSILSGLSLSFPQLLFCRFFMGVFGAAIIPLSLILIARLSVKQRRGKFVGLFFSATFASSLLGLFLSGILEWRFIYIIPGIFGLLVLLHAYFYFPSYKLFNEEPIFNYRLALKDARVLRLFLYIFSISLIYHSLRQWLGVFFSQSYALEQFFISMLLAVISFGGIFGEALGGHLSDIIGRLKIAKIGIFLMALSLFSLTFYSPLPILYILMFVWGLGWTFNHAAVSALLTDLPQKYIPESASLNSSVRFLAGGIGMILARPILERSFNLGFIIFGALLLLLSTFSLKSGES